jgi:uncharacterized BrkB/YihY/UPF0761 family membrane protein
VAFLFFLVVYVVIPNRKVPIRLAWKGALVAGVLLEAYHLFFPFYAVHHVHGQSVTSAAAFSLLVAVYFYYFGLMLLLGAELTAFLADRTRRAPG